MSRFSRLLFCLFLVVSAVLLRLPGYNKKVWNLDEGSTFTMAEVVRHGGVLYRDAADNRSPLVPYAKAVILAVVGDWNVRDSHVVISGMLGLVAVLLWQIGRRAGDERTGVLAALFFTLVSFVMLGAFDAMTAHTGWFVIFFSALGMWLFVCAVTRQSSWCSFLAGTAFALSFLSKQPGLLDFLVCLVLCVLTAVFVPAQRRGVARLALWAVAGFVWPSAGAAVYFIANHAWADAVYYAWTYNTTLYVPEIPRWERLLAIREPFRLAGTNATAALLLGIVGAVGLLATAWKGIRRRPAEFQLLPWLILGWSASGLVSTALSGRDFEHYSIQVMPGLCLACGWVTVRLWAGSAAWIEANRRGAARALRVVIVVAGLSLLGTAGHRAATLDTSEGFVSDVGGYIRHNTEATDRIFVWGYFPEVHVFARRLPATRFIYTVFLNGMIPWTNLAPEKNTDYAIVPGSWDALYRDLAAHPPAIIVDTRGNRSYLKYPLAKQDKLWRMIETEFAEVQHDYFEPRGFGIYQRLAPVTSAPLPENLATTDRVRISAPRSGNANASIRVEVPVGTDWIELYDNGHQLRRIAAPHQANGQVTFVVNAATLTAGLHRLQAVARGPAGVLASAPHDFKAGVAAEAGDAGGPPIAFAGGEIHAIESRTARGDPIAFTAQPDRWDAHPPSRLVYRRPPDMYSLTLSYGIMQGAFDGSFPQKTDGYEVQFDFEDDNGQVTTLYKQLHDPTNNGRDQLLQTATVVLPPDRPGRIVLTIAPGKRNDQAYDWTYWKSLTADRTPMRLRFRGQPVFPTAVDAPLGVTVAGMGRRDVVLIHMPAHADFAMQSGMNELAGEFGMLDQAWKNEQKTAGAVFEILHLRPGQEPVILFSRVLDPGQRREDRGLQSFRIKLPVPAEGSLRFVTRPLHPPNNSFGYTYWHNLVVGDYPASLHFDGREINSLSSDAPAGFSIQTEAGQPVLLAPAPSQMVFPLEAEARRLTGSFGLLRGAYTGNGTCDGVSFVVELEDTAGKRTELLRRFLNPRDIETDRGILPFEVELPATDESRLVLRTEPAPTGNASFGWSFWKDLQFVGTPAAVPAKSQ